MSQLKKLKKIKQIRIHHEGNGTLFMSIAAYIAVGYALYHFFGLQSPVAWALFALCTIVLCYVINFFRCPIRLFEGDTRKTVIAPADGRVVVVEEVEEPEYFGGARRKMVSIFMSVTNVHANWFPVEGVVKLVRHHDGAFYKAWLPKASTENERSTVVIETPEGAEVLVRQVAGALARRIVTYAQEGDNCYIDEHLGFIKFGSRVDVYLPLDADVKVAIGDRTVGNETILAMLK
ncbi:MAG: phosphatidylserine decarboxylase family protein [Bacteroidales bacterium]|nr:phosphatidylserine decarboxylase family protein [Bacteroidales bacterium]